MNNTLVALAHLFTTKFRYFLLKNYTQASETLCPYLVKISKSLDNAKYFVFTVKWPDVKKRNEWEKNAAILELNINIFAWKLYTSFAYVIFITHKNFSEFGQ